MVTNKLLSKYKSLPVQVRASPWFFVCSFLQKGISVITTPIFTRLLSTAEYGQYNVFNSWYGIISIFVALRLSMGVYAQGLVKFEEERNRFSSSLQGLTLVNLYCLSQWNQQSAESNHSPDACDVAHDMDNCCF